MLKLECPDDFHAENCPLLAFWKKYIKNRRMDRPSDGHTLIWRCEDASKNDYGDIWSNNSLHFQVAERESEFPECLVRKKIIWGPQSFSMLWKSISFRKKEKYSEDIKSSPCSTCFFFGNPISTHGSCLEYPFGKDFKKICQKVHGESRFTAN